MKNKLITTTVILAVLAVAIYFLAPRKPHALTITSIVTTDDVHVSAQIQGRLQKLLVREGDAVRKGELLAVIQPRELKADKTFYEGASRSRQRR